MTWMGERNPDCHFGDHRWAANGWCKDCDAFNGGLLQFARFDAAEKAGTLIWHGDPEDEAGNAHYHFAEKAASACRAYRTEPGETTDE